MTIGQVIEKKNDYYFPELTEKTYYDSSDDDPNETTQKISINEYLPFQDLIRDLELESKKTPAERVDSNHSTTSELVLSSFSNNSLTLADYCEKWGSEERKGQNEDRVLNRMDDPTQKVRIKNSERKANQDPSYSDLETDLVLDDPRAQKKKKIKEEITELRAEGLLERPRLSYAQQGKKKKQKREQSSIKTSWKEKLTYVTKKAVTAVAAVATALGIGYYGSKSYSSELPEPKDVQQISAYHFPRNTLYQAQPSREQSLDAAVAKLLAKKQSKPVQNVVKKVHSQKGNYVYQLEEEPYDLIYDLELGKNEDSSPTELRYNVKVSLNFLKNLKEQNLKEALDEALLYNKQQYRIKRNLQIGVRDLDKLHLSKDGYWQMSVGPLLQ